MHTPVNIKANADHLTLNDQVYKTSTSTATPNCMRASTGNMLQYNPPIQ